MPSPDAPLTLMEAIDRARAEGFTVDVLAGFVDHTHELLISLDTVDPDPTLALRTDRSRSEALLSERGQSGSERWEYPFSLSEYRDRFFLRVSSGSGIVDVPVLPAVFSIVEQYGWVEDLSLSAPARVNRRDFDDAITQLVRSGEREVFVP